MQTENTNRPLTGLFAAPVVTAEPAADPPPVPTLEPARSCPRPTRQGPRRAGLVAITALMVVLLLTLAAADHGPAPKSAPAPSARAPKAARVQHPAHATVRHTGRKRARAARRHRRPRRAQHIVAARRVARPVVAAPAPAPARAVPVFPAPYWRPAPAPVRSEEFF